MAYRNEIDALQARLANIEADLGERTLERDEVAHMLAEARERARREDYEARAPIRRRRRWIFAVVASGLLALGGIASLFVMRSGPRRLDIDQAIDEMQMFSDRMCACKEGDQACAQSVSDAMTKWSEAVTKQYPKHDYPKPTDEQMKRIMGIADTLTKCMSRAMMGPPPHDPVPAAQR